MNMSLILAISWVLAATAVAFLPMRRQYLPGVCLLVVAPVLVVWIGLDFGWVAAAGALAAFVSMFRNPLRYLWTRARGQFARISE